MTFFIVFFLAIFISGFGKAYISAENVRRELILEAESQGLAENKHIAAAGLWAKADS